LAGRYVVLLFPASVLHIPARPWDILFVHMFAPRRRLFASAPYSKSLQLTLALHPCLASCSHMRERGDLAGRQSVISFHRSLSWTILASISFLVPSLDNLLEIQDETSSSTFICPASLSQHTNEFIHNVIPFIVDLACARLQMFAKRRSLVETLFAGTAYWSGLSDVKAIVDRVMSCEFG
jgi:hypothetical protein